MNEQLDELLGPKPKRRLEKIMDAMIKHGSTAGTVKSSTANIKKMKKSKTSRAGNVEK
jgi:hypothetical protein